MLKSKLFRSFDLEDDIGKALRTDIALLARLDEPSRQALLDELVNVHTASTHEDRLQLIEGIAAKTPLSVVDVAHAYRPLVLLLETFVTHGADNSVELIGEDLRTTELSNEGTHETLVRTVTRVREIASQASARIERAVASYQVLPNLRTIQASVELRAIVDEEYDSSFSVEEYAPTVRDTAGIVSVRLQLDAGPTPDVFFQATPEVVAVLVHRLSAALKELGALTRYARPQDSSTSTRTTHEALTEAV